jgi:hypothetical protein
MLGSDTVGLVSPLSVFGPRDPGGTDASTGRKIAMGQEPMGLAFGENEGSPQHVGSTGLEKPATPVRHRSEASPIVAMLVGEPPPPPTSAPPSRRGSRSTPRFSNRGSSYSFEDSTIATVESRRNKNKSVEDRLRITRASLMARGIGIHIDPPTGLHDCDQSDQLPTPRLKDENDEPTFKIVLDQENQQPSVEPQAYCTSPLSVKSDPSIAPFQIDTLSTSSPRETIAETQVHSTTAERMQPVGRQEDKLRSSGTMETFETTAANRTAQYRQRSVNAFVESEGRSFEDVPKEKRKGFFGKLFGRKNKRGTSSLRSERASDETHVSLATSVKTMEGEGSATSTQTDSYVESRNGNGVVSSRHFLSAASHEQILIANDRPGSVYLAQDEVSTITVPTLYAVLRKDPEEERTGLFSEPAGVYRNIVGKTDTMDDDGYLEPFRDDDLCHGEPEGVSPHVSDEGTDVQLAVSTVNDPVGASPLNSNKGASLNETPQMNLHDPSPKGFQIPSTQHPFNDPIGDSPLHKQLRGPTAFLDGSPYAQDPPLHVLDIKLEIAAANGAMMRSGSPLRRSPMFRCSSSSSLVSLPPPPPPPPPPLSLPPLRKKNKTLQMRSTSLASTEKTEGTDPLYAATPMANGKSDDVSPNSHPMEDGEPALGDRESSQYIIIKAGGAEAELVDTPTATDEATRVFSAYSEKFKGRKPSKPDPKPRVQGHVQARQTTTAQAEKTNIPAEKPVSQWQPTEKLARDISISSFSVRMGFNVCRKRREADIVAGKSVRVVPMEKGKVSEVSSNFGPLSVQVQEPRDPIRRASLRLLSKSAVPLQNAARRYLAQKRAVDRMWGLLEIQCYMRRWRAETHLLACRVGVTTIQRVFRGFRARDAIRAQKYAAATAIQKVFRGYIASLHVYEDIYRVLLIQAIARGKQTRDELSMRSFCATRIQALVRGWKSRSTLQLKIQSATKVQSTWRMFEIRQCFQFVVVDVIICQSIVRRCLACRHVAKIKIIKENESALSIQTAWRDFATHNRIARHTAAVKIQAAFRDYSWRAYTKRNCSAVTLQAIWRGFQAYTDFIFALVDIIIVQRTIRRFLAKRKVEDMRRKAFLAHEDLQERSSIKIQAAWRGFWLYSHFLILRYEAVRVQAVVRGRLAQRRYIVTIGSCIMIQTAIRRYFGHKRRMQRIVSKAVANSIETRLVDMMAATKLQTWWRSLFLRPRKEKKAALVIERFFLMVKEEVDREIRYAQERQKQKLKRKKKKVQDEKVREEVWFQMSKNYSQTDDISFHATSELSISRPPIDAERNLTVRHAASSPSMRLVMRHDRESPERDTTAHQAPFSRTLKSLLEDDSSVAHKSKSLLEDTNSARFDSIVAVGISKPNTSCAEKYRLRYGLSKSESSRSSGKNHFFGGSATIRSDHRSFSPTSEYKPKSKGMRSNVSPRSRKNEMLGLPYSESPRHGRILVMQPYPESDDKTNKYSLADFEEDLMGEEFGMI